MGMVMDDEGRRGLRERGPFRTQDAVVPAILAFALLVIVGLVYGASSEIRRVHDVAVRTAELSAANLARAAEEHVVQTVRRVDQALRQLRADYLERPDDFAARARAWQETHLSDLGVQIGAIDPDGMMRFSNLQPAAPPVDLSDREHFRVHRDSTEDRLFISKPVIGRVSGRWSIQFTRRMSNPDGAFAGVMVLSVDPGYFSKFYETIDIGREGVITLVGQDRVVRSRAAHDGTAADNLGAVLPEERPFFDPAKPDAGTLRYASSIDGLDRIGAYRRVRGYPLIVLVLMSAREVLAPAEAEAREVWTRAGAVAVSVLLGAGALAGLAWRLRAHARWLEDAKAQVAQAEERTRLALEAVGDGVWDWDAATNEVFFSRSWKAMLGFAEHEISGRLEEWDQRIHPDDRDAVYADLNRHLSGEVPFYANEHRVRCKDGSYKWILDRGIVVARGEDGSPLRVVGTHTDITARRRAEEALKVSEERYATVLDVTGAGVWDWDIANDKAVHNRQWCRILGLDDTFLEHPAEDFVARLHEDDRAAVLERIGAALRGEGPYASEHRMRRPDGSVVWVSDRGVVTARDAGGRPLRMLGSIADVTDRKAAELARRASEERYRSVVTAMSEGIVIQDREGRIVECNPAAERILGYPRDALLGRISGDAGWRALRAYGTPLPGEEHPAMRCLRDGEPVRGVVMGLPGKLPGSGEAVTWISVNAEPLFDADGRVAAVVTSFADVTARLDAERELRRSNAELEQFAYVVSHDLRQPLRMVGSYVRLLERHLGDGLDDDAREFIGFVADGAKRMDQMLVSLLEYSRVGRVGEPMCEVDAREVLDEALRFLGPAIAEAGAEVRVSGDWPRVVASRDEGVRLFQNLVGNALKYRAPDRVPVVEVSAGPAADGWSFAVRDNGIGIDPAQFGRLFKVFQRLHGRNEYEGTGIGLAVCRKIVERHGGRIWVESEPGTGSTFRFTLPRREAPAV